MPKYNHQSIEQKWQQRWSDQLAFEARDDDPRPKEYLLVEFPYPSGDGLHVGHIRPYVALDVVARKHRMEGKNVLYPFGWDAFGLPTENYAIKKGIHPAVATKQNTDRFRKQIQALGISFDWSREVNTTDPAYYKWTQWIFLQLLKHGLAYKARVPINWCPSCKIGLANEEAVGGACERCGGPVEKRDREQWMLKITAYAEKLLEGLEHVDYIERAKVQQINWIGRSEGAVIPFRVIASEAKQSQPLRSDEIATSPESTPLRREAPAAGAPRNDTTVEVFTTRPDTLFGATYLVLAPEHAAISNLKFQISNWPEVEAYIGWARRRTDIERTAEEKEKTGVELKGVRAINPANGEAIPVWIADYVLAHYGTGAIMAVPAHDERDFAFARKYGLPITVVIARRADGHRPDAAISAEQEEGAYIGDGILVNSGKFTAMASTEAKRAITEAVGGTMTVTYKLRDWVFSRQRYWGEPIPVVFCAKCTKGQPRSGEWRVESGELSGSATVNCQLSTINSIPHAIVPVPEDQLPVELPNVEKYQPTDTGDSPLAAITDWVNTTCPHCGGPAKRETDVMPNWAGSSWYFLAYAMRGNPKSEIRNPKLDWDKTKLAYWMPVDWYNGGMEHTTLHLLYSRFWNLFLHDIGVVPVAEPYKKRTSHGLILAQDGEKMSKSRGNVVNPDEIVERFGADAVRVYEMFIGPFDQPVPWSTDGLVGCRRFLERVWTYSTGPIQRVTEERDEHVMMVALHKTIKKVTSDIEAMRFNTAISCLMEFINAVSGDPRPFAHHRSELRRQFLILLAPFAPHVSAELWEVGGYSGNVWEQSWPTFDAALVVDDEFDLVVQVNGKVRATIRVPAGITEDEAKARALAEPNVAKYVGEKQVKKAIFVPKRLVNIVV
jgi:leucyl-tRNA synthetase